MTIATIIVAAGRGERAGAGLPKQWRKVAGRSSVDWCLQRFQAQPDIGPIVLVIHPDDVERVNGGETGILVVMGGTTRSASVLNGLKALQSLKPDLVLIHDVARPCVSPQVIAGVIDALSTHQAAAPALAVTDALWRGGAGLVVDTQDRAYLFRAQTPQGFQYAAILKAHLEFQGQAADDVAVARAAGLSVRITPGDADNLKITTPGDFIRADRILRGAMDIRTGNGFDVHAFETGDHVTLCGVSIPHSAALKGHSDADVAMHALTDAIYGALGQGDIGQWFPPSDPQWKGAASDIFLRHAGQLAADNGFTLTHADVTIICERPKIGPHAGAMKDKLAQILAIEPSRISVKATTSEQLGFTGRGEGIAALATATLVKS